jgi:hypothetical protein
MPSGRREILGDPLQAHLWHRVTNPFDEVALDHRLSEDDLSPTSSVVLRNLGLREGILTPERGPGFDKPDLELTP